MTVELTKKEKQKVKAAVLRELELDRRDWFDNRGVLVDEARRLLTVAIKAVRSAK